MSALASTSAPMPAPMPLADGRSLVATGTIGGAARVPGRLETSVVAAVPESAPAEARARKRGIARPAATAKAWVAVRLAHVRRQRVLPWLDRVHLNTERTQRLTLPTSRQSTLRRMQFVEVFVQVVRVLTHRRSRFDTVHVSGFAGRLGGVMTGVPWVCAAPTADDGAGAATAGAASTATATSASVSAARDARRRLDRVIEIMGIVVGAPPSSTARALDNTSAMHG